jgi:hypothetical protein
MMAGAAGAEIALDANDALAGLRPDLAVVDCMLPAPEPARGRLFPDKTGRAYVRSSISGLVIPPTPA